MLVVWARLALDSISSRQKMRRTIACARRPVGQFSRMDAQLTGPGDASRSSDWKVAQRMNARPTDTKCNGNARQRTFSICFLLYLTTIVAIASAAYLISPSFGFLYGFDVLCVGYLFASFSRIPGIWPFSERRGIFDLLLLFYICIMLHGIQIYGVST